MKKIKMFIKELKRVRWTPLKIANKDFLVVLFFIFLNSIFLFGVAFIFTTIWSNLGVGLNG
jgi:preprotein translocase SecE subunit